MQNLTRSSNEAKNWQHLKWNPPHDANGIIRNYTIESYCEKNDFNNFYVVEVTDPDKQDYSYTIKDLPFITYCNISVHVSLGIQYALKYLFSFSVTVTLYF